MAAARSRGVPAFHTSDEAASGDPVARIGSFFGIAGFAVQPPIAGFAKTFAAAVELRTGSGAVAWRYAR